MKKLILLLLFSQVTFTQELDTSSEKSFIDYFDKNGAHSIEGIWGCFEFNNNINYKLGIIATDKGFESHILNKVGKYDKTFFPGDLKAIFSFSDKHKKDYEVKWLLKNKKTWREFEIKMIDSSTIEFSNIYLTKIFPSVKKNEYVSNSESSTIKWRQNPELSIKNWLDKNKLNSIEGIWILSTPRTGNYQRVAIVSKSFLGVDSDEYIIVFLNDLNNYKSGFISGALWADVTKAASEGVYIFNKDNFTFTSIENSSGYMRILMPGGEASAIKEYPLQNTNKSKSKNGEWAGNGSGVIISKSGYIITNHHVIEDADDIEVEFILNDEVQKFNAEIVQVDKTNDLAIIKIFDMNFDGVDELPYNFKTRSSDVGTKVYAFGYPMALSIMGKEIKVTDGIISSKTGFDGDITTYQITAPIQGGNSGGPLFDEKGNLIGINSTGIRKDVADNVAYSIKTSYVLNLIDVLPKSIELPSNTKLESLPLTEQIKEISKYVVLIKVK
jgi:S1-C subfamily serine protease